MVECASCGNDLPESAMEKFTYGNKVYDVCNNCIQKVRAVPNLYLKVKR